MHLRLWSKAEYSYTAVVNFSNVDATLGVYGYGSRTVELTVATALSPPTG
jgi:hypothetical protein